LQSDASVGRLVGAEQIPESRSTIGTAVRGTYVGGNSTTNTTITIGGGSFSLFSATLIVISVLVFGGIGIAYIQPMIKFFDVPSHQLPYEEISLSEGAVSLTPGYAVIDASTPLFNNSLHVSFKLSFENNQYHPGTFRLDRSFPGKASLTLPGPKFYSLPEQASDLILTIEEAPTTSGSFMKAKINGRVTNGTESQKINLKLMLPVSRFDVSK
jgi:hypothetical protein